MNKKNKKKFDLAIAYRIKSSSYLLTRKRVQLLLMNITQAKIRKSAKVIFQVRSKKSLFCWREREKKMNPTSNCFLYFIAVKTHHSYRKRKIKIEAKRRLKSVLFKCRLASRKES